MTQTQKRKSPPPLSRKRFAASRQRNFGYDAVVASNRRRLAAPILRSEDWELQPANRKQLVASQRDIVRNFAIARWAVERHLDYVTTFTFKMRARSQKLNDLIQMAMANWFKPKNS